MVTLVDPELFEDHRFVSTSKTTFRVRPEEKSSEKRVSEDKRYLLYQEAWSSSLKKITNLIEEVQTDLLEDVIDFLRSIKFSQPSTGLIRKPIPTIILLGSSSLLNESVCQRISNLKKLTDGGFECLTVRLSSRTCLSLSPTIKSIVDQLQVRLDHLKPSEGSSKKPSKKSKVNLSKDDVQNIRAIYQEHRGHHLEGPKLVIVIDDFEGFDTLVLEDLIIILSGLLKNIPVVLVISVSTSADAISSLLPRTVFLRLQMTPFTVELDERTVSSIIKKVTLSADGPFDVSPGVIRSLINSHRHLNNSVDSLISKLQFIHLAHFYTNPLCELFDSDLKSQEGDRSRGSVPENLSFIALHLRLTSSWQSARMKELKTDEETIEILLESYRKRKSFRKFTISGIDTLECLGRLWPEKAKNVEWILYNIYRSELVTYAQEICKLIKHSNDETVMEVLNVLSNFSELEMIGSNRLKLSKLISEDQDSRKSIGRTHLVNINEPLMVGIKLLECDKSFTSIVNEVSSYLLEFFRTNLGPSNLLLLHEAWTFDDKILLNEVFHPPYIEKLKSDLVDKASTLTSEDEENDSHPQNHQNRMNLSNIYKLYLDSNGKLINLMDWFGAYQSVISNNNRNEKTKSPKKRRKNISSSSTSRKKDKNKEQEDEQGRDEDEDEEIDEEYEVLKSFLRGVGDLGFIGFISGYNSVRKREHVCKNVW